MRTKEHVPTANTPSKSIQIKNLQSAHWHFLNQISKTRKQIQFKNTSSYQRTTLKQDTKKMDDVLQDKHKQWSN
jgi:hypothetical protein